MVLVLSVSLCAPFLHELKLFLIEMACNHLDNLFRLRLSKHCCKEHIGEIAFCASDSARDFSCPCIGENSKSNMVV